MIDSHDTQWRALANFRQGTNVPFFLLSYETNILEVVFWFVVCLGYILSCKRSALFLNNFNWITKISLISFTCFSDTL